MIALSKPISSRKAIIAPIARVGKFVVCRDIKNRDVHVVNTISWEEIPQEKPIKVGSFNYLGEVPWVHHSAYPPSSERYCLVRIEDNGQLSLLGTYFDEWHTTALFYSQKSSHDIYYLYDYSGNTLEINLITNKIQKSRILYELKGDWIRLIKFLSEERGFDWKFRFQHGMALGTIGKYIVAFNYVGIIMWFCKKPPVDISTISDYKVRGRFLYVATKHQILITDILKAMHPTQIIYVLEMGILTQFDSLITNKEYHYEVYSRLFDRVSYSVRTFLFTPNEIIISGFTIRSIPYVMRFSEQTYRWSPDCIRAEAQAFSEAIAPRKLPRELIWHIVSFLV